MTEPTLASVLAERATLLEGATAAPGDDGTAWRLDAVVFAVVAGSLVEFRLRPEVAAATLRTADVTASPRGAGWIRFSPPTLDGFALDRALAWFELAWRVADESSGG